MPRAQVPEAVHQGRHRQQPSACGMHALIRGQSQGLLALMLLLPMLGKGFLQNLHCTSS
jgi:hypothetical protein